MYRKIVKSNYVPVLDLYVYVPLNIRIRHGGGLAYLVGSQTKVAGLGGQSPCYPSIPVKSF